MDNQVYRLSGKNDGALIGVQNMKDRNVVNSITGDGGYEAGRDEEWQQDQDARNRVEEPGTGNDVRNTDLGVEQVEELGFGAFNKDGYERRVNEETQDGLGGLGKIEEVSREVEARGGNFVNMLPPGVSVRETTKTAVDWAERTVERALREKKGDPAGLLDAINDQRRVYRGMGDSEEMR